MNATSLAKPFGGTVIICCCFSLLVFFSPLKSLLFSLYKIKFTKCILVLLQGFPCWCGVCLYHSIGSYTAEHGRLGIRAEIRCSHRCPRGNCSLQHSKALLLLACLCSNLCSFLTFSSEWTALLLKRNLRKEWALFSWGCWPRSQECYRGQCCEYQRMSAETTFWFVTAVLLPRSCVRHFVCCLRNRVSMGITGMLWI